MRDFKSAMAVILLALVSAGSAMAQAATLGQANMMQAPAQAETAPLPEAAPMPASDALVDAPPGFISFCLRDADQCALPDHAATIVHLTPMIWELMDRVNRSENDAIVPEEDSEHYGRADYWTIATDGYGDCEDYALTKRKALIDAGLPIAALRIAVVRTPRDRRHAVLTVATDRGDFVLDSLDGDVRPWTDVDYAWIERQDPLRPWGWDRMQGYTAEPLLTADTK